MAISEISLEEDLVPQPTEGLQLHDKLRSLFNFRSYKLLREFLAEILGTFILCFIGLGGLAQQHFAQQQNSFQASFVFGMAVITACMIVGKTSGAHLNPAVSFAFYLIDRISALRMIVYFIAQIIGAFLGALIVYLTYYNALDHSSRETDGNFDIKSAKIFVTFPQDYLSIWGGFFDQVVGTAFLILAILGITDKKNLLPSQSTIFVLIGIVVAVHGAAFGHNCGGAINPARDFGPRLFCLMAGWGDKVFTLHSYFFWIPIVAPMVGAAIGTFLYYIFIGNNW